MKDQMADRRSERADGTSEMTWRWKIRDERSEMEDRKSEIGDVRPEMKQDSL